jgi:hypothetical protein
MAGVRFTELQSRPMEFLDFTSVTLDEFQQLVPPFETAFQCHMAVWRMDGKPPDRSSVYRVTGREFFGVQMLLDVAMAYVKHGTRKQGSEKNA